LSERVKAIPLHKRQSFESEETCLLQNLGKRDHKHGSHKHALIAASARHIINLAFYLTGASSVAFRRAPKSQTDPGVR
jgi:hypothetical protein